jgi:CheY-like chemotaxis protein
MLDGDFAVVLCDLRLTDMTGTDVLLWSRRVRPDLAVRFVMVTGAVGSIDPDRFEVPVLAKPFSSDELRAVVATIVNARVREPCLDGRRSRTRSSCPSSPQ